MNPEQKAEAERLFAEATRTGVDDVLGWAQGRTQDAEVRQELGRMQASARTLHDARPPQTAGLAADSHVGLTIGQYTVARLIGAGGMGRVYEATGGNPPRTVALKLLLRSALDEGTRRRFEREIRILQTLQHPSIAQLYESGMMQDGSSEVPWYAMEYLAGARSIIDFAEEKRLPTGARLRLFAEVCDGVAQAHQAGIVHRDLKPANVLVDGGGRVKVIDFGVARGESADASFATVRTETGQIVGTMQYMSPEQFAADPRGIDRRVDVYALGVVLFELLSGTHPYDTRGLPIHEAANLVCHGSLARLSGSLAECDEALDELLATAMARQRQDRFDDAGALAEAIRRYLAQLKERVIGSARRKAGVVPKPKTAASPVPSAGRHDRKGRLGWVMTALIVIVIVGGALAATGVLDFQGLLAKARQLVARDPEPEPTGPKRGEPAGDSVVESASVESTPPRARILLDGVSVGTTPTTILLSWRANSKAAEVRLELDGYQPFTTLVSPDPELKRGRPVRITAELAPSSP